MQNCPTAYSRWKNRLASPTLQFHRSLLLWMAVAGWLVGNTTASHSQTGIEPRGRFDGPACCEQPRHADEVWALFSQPSDVVIREASYPSLQVSPLSTSETSPVDFEHFPQLTVNLEQVSYLHDNVKRLASKWHSNLLFAETEQGSESSEEKSEILALPETSDEVEDNNKGASCYSLTPMQQLTVRIDQPKGKLPQNAYARCVSHSLSGDRRLDGGWMQYDYHWAATGMCHRPLYFEEINAERFGYTPSYALQPFISGIRFFTSIPALPYKMALDCPRDCTYTLGHYRPGSCNPYRWNRLPLRIGAATVEVGFIAGMILLIP